MNKEWLGAIWPFYILKKNQGSEVSRKLKALDIPYLWMATKEYKQAYNPAEDKVTVLTIHSSKGLEFPAVIMLGVGHLHEDEENRQKNARLLYVGMTRAQKQLLLTASKENEFSRMLMNGAAIPLQA
jgi:superfamily I DNA/RNA helicase